MITLEEWDNLVVGNELIISGAFFVIDSITANRFGGIAYVQSKDGYAVSFMDNHTIEFPEFKVSVADNRPFPEYKNTPIMALTRNTLNEAGWDWKECVELVERIQEVIRDADYLMDDYGNSWARVQS